MHRDEDEVTGKMTKFDEKMTKFEGVLLLPKLFTLLLSQILPAVAKLAQDGSQEARTYAKATLVSFLDCGVDWERALKKNLTQNTMRSLDKVLEALKGGGGGGGMISSSSSVASKGRSGHSTLSRRPLRAKRRALSRKTL